MCTAGLVDDNIASLNLVIDAFDRHDARTLQDDIDLLVIECVAMNSN
jgi:hypothetical protein